VTKDKDVKGYLRLVAHYRDPFGDKGTVFIDLNSRASLVLKPERNNVSHFYEGYIPAFCQDGSSPLNRVNAGDRG